MRLLALSAAALSLASTAIAQSSSWSTATSTRTVYMVMTETRTGTPAAETLNSTSSTVFTRPSYGAPVPTGVAGSNGTLSVANPTAPSAAHPTFTGAAAAHNGMASFAVLIGGAVVALAL